eukprot:1090663-Amphidinium_carterae.1
MYKHLKKLGLRVRKANYFDLGDYALSEVDYGLRHKTESQRVGRPIPRAGWTSTFVAWGGQ